MNLSYSISESVMNQRVVIGIAVLVVVLVLLWCMSSKSPSSDDRTSGEVTLALFFSDYCGHCMSFKPVWEKLKGMSLPVNLREFSQGQLQGFDITGVPTLRLYRGDVTPDNRNFVVYKGARNADAIAAFVQSN